MVRKGQLRIYRIGIGLVLLSVIITSACTIKKIGDNGGKDGDMYSTWEKTGTGFDAVKYVEANWNTKIIPAFKNESIEASEVLQSLETNLEITAKNYGYRKEEGAPEVFFKVKGQGRVLRLNDSSRVGLLDIDLDPEDGIADLFLQVGPVIKRTEIRDSLSFIKFTNVGNQLQFASLSDELNKSVLNLTLKGISLSDIVGKKIEFYGVFSVENGAVDIANIIITPVILKIIQ